MRLLLLPSFVSDLPQSKHDSRNLEIRIKTHWLLTDGVISVRAAALFASPDPMYLLPRGTWTLNCPGCQLLNSLSLTSRTNLPALEGPEDEWKDAEGTIHKSGWTKNSYIYLDRLLNLNCKTDAAKAHTFVFLFNNSIQLIPITEWSLKCSFQN